jgi:hypothetical protein
MPNIAVFENINSTLIIPLRGGSNYYRSCLTEEEIET